MSCGELPGSYTSVRGETGERQDYQTEHPTRRNRRCGEVTLQSSSSDHSTRCVYRFSFRMGGDGDDLVGLGLPAYLVSREDNRPSYFRARFTWTGIGGVGGSVVHMPSILGFLPIGCV